MKYNFIKNYRIQFPVSRICHVLNISKSGYYTWLKKPKSNRDLENEGLLQKIINFHEKSGEKVWKPKNL